MFPTSPSWPAFLLASSATRAIDDRTHAMVNVGVIGYGYWGPNLVRNFMEVPGSTVAAVSDLRDARLAEVARRYPSIRCTKSAAELFSDPAIDAVIIATPVFSHFDLAMQA